MNEKDKVITALLYHMDLGKIAVTGHGEYNPVTPYEELSLLRKDGRTYMTLVPTQGVDPATDADMEHYMLICEKGEDWFEAYVRINHYEGSKEEFFQMVKQKLEMLDTRAAEAREAADKAILEAQKALDAAEEANMQVQIAIQTIADTNAVKEDALNVIRLTNEAKSACIEATERANAAKDATEEVARATVELNTLMEQAKDDAVEATGKTNEALEKLQKLVSDLNEAERLRVESQNQREAYDELRKTFYEQAEIDEKARKEFYEQTKISVAEWDKKETARVAAEEQRVTEFATLKKNSESATTAANKAAEHAETSATTIDDKINPVVESDKAQNDYLVRLDRRLSKLVPEGMSLKYLKRISIVNKVPQKVTAILVPSFVVPNVIFQQAFYSGDALYTDPLGNLTIRKVGKATIHVIPTNNTALAQTIEIEVVPAMLRKSKKGLRLTTGGKLRLY